MLLTFNRLKPSGYKYLTSKGYRPSNIIWALKGDWEPGPYPTTKEEREKAAIKYGLIPEDYDTYPNDGTGIGDYPKLPLIAGLKRDPYYSWNSEFFRDYKEPMHLTWSLTSDRFNPNFIPKGGWAFNMLFAWGIFIGFIILCHLAEPYKPLWPVMQKTFPYDFHEARDKVHNEGIYPDKIRRKVHFDFPNYDDNNEHH